uniref:Uncharacterized protein n=1 Tax=Brassica oleracea var. oleracea TaxID=109376 RepID=A0A0D3D6C2_BRAOL
MAGYEAQRRLNQQMMEMMQRMYPNEVFPDVPDPFKFRGNEPSEYSEGHIPQNIPRDLFLGIFRGFISSKIPDENSEEHSVETSEVNSEEVFPRYIPRSFPTNWWSSEFPRNSVGKFRGISEEKRISEELFPRTCFVGMSSE